MLLLALLALAAAAPPGRAAPALTEEEEAGRRLFEEGTRPDGSAVLAHLDTEPSPLPASALPCAGCHGRDGLGRPEGAVVPPAITWGELTRPRGHLHGRRAHPPFDERRLALAVQEGVDPAGHRLDPAMPSYSLSRADVGALVAWLKRLEHRRDPGLGETVIRLGTVLPASGPGRQAGLAMRAVLEATLAEVNAAGGVNGRTLALVPVEVDGGAAAAAGAVRDLATARDAFALVAGFLPGGEQALADAAEEAGVPAVGLPTARRRPGPDGRAVFDLLGGVPEQARLLVDFAARDLGLAGSPAVVLRPEGADLAGGVEAALAQGAAAGWTGWREEALPAEGLDRAGVERLAAGDTAVVLHLGDDAALAALLRAAAAAGWAPTVLVPGALAGRAVAAAPAGFTGRLFLAYPSSPADETEAGRARLTRLAGSAAPGRYRALQASAVGAVSLLVEGLRRAGRALSREGLVRALEGIQGLSTGLAPALSFGPGRRVGALGGYVVVASPARGALRPVGGWRSLE